MRLEDEMKARRLPQSILFSGSPYTSRMTTALELALCLSGEEDKFDTLESANIIALSSRDSTLRIRALRNLYEKDMTSSAFLNLVHEVRVMLLSCHEALYTNSDKEVFAAASELSSVLMEEPAPDDREASSQFLSAFDKAYDLFISKRRKSSLFTIDQIRLIQSYLQQNSEQNKVVILGGCQHRCRQLDPQASGGTSRGCIHHFDITECRPHHRYHSLSCAPLRVSISFP